MLLGSHTKKGKRGDRSDFKTQWAQKAPKKLPNVLKQVCYVICLGIEYGNTGSVCDNV